VSAALVIETDPADDIRRLGEWLTEAGLRLHVVRPHAGDPLPEDLTGYQALVLLGREPASGAEGMSGWPPMAESLLRKAVRQKVATLAIGHGAQLLAAAHAGTVAPAANGPEYGARLVARRDVAESDPLFARVPFSPDVIQWHENEITELPVGAVLLAASTRSPHQAFRLGPVAWGLQFHIEADMDMVASWVATDSDRLHAHQLDPEAVVAAVEEVMGLITDVWQPFAARFAAVARGDLRDPSRTVLPLISP